MKTNIDVVKVWCCHSCCSYCIDLNADFLYCSRCGGMMTSKTYMESMKRINKIGKEEMEKKVDLIHKQMKLYLELTSTFTDRKQFKMLDDLSDAERELEEVFF